MIFFNGNGMINIFSINCKQQSICSSNDSDLSLYANKTKQNEMERKTKNRWNAKFPHSSTIRLFEQVLWWCRILPCIEIKYWFWHRANAVVWLHQNVHLMRIHCLIWICTFFFLMLHLVCHLRTRNCDNRIRQSAQIQQWLKPVASQLRASCKPVSSIVWQFSLFCCFISTYR